MRACAYAREDGFIGIFTIQFPRFSICTFPCRSFPLHCVLKNEPLLLSKRHVVSPKTTRHFFQNDPSLFPKRPVVFPKTTRHFFQNDPSFYPYLCFNLHKTKLFHYDSFLLNLYALRFSLDGTHNGGTANISFVAPPFGENRCQSSLFCN